MNAHSNRYLAAPLLAILAVMLLSGPLLAQEATPEATPAGDEEITLLFVQTFASGTWMPKEGEPGMYLLTLGGISSETVYFTDRPAHRVGLIPTGEFIEALGFPPDNPPNAALTAMTEEDGLEVLVIELFAPVYDAASDTLTYEALLLEEYTEAELADLAERAEDSELPASFGVGQLFIDSCTDPVHPCIII